MSEINRRQILEWSLMASSAILVGAGCGGSSNTTGGTGAGGHDGGTGSSDVDSLNTLLGLEYAGIAAYTAGAGILGSPPAGDPLTQLAPTLLAVAKHFQSQHQDHATALSAAVTAAGGTPIPNTVTFTPPTGFTPSVTNVLKLAANAERAAAVTYARLVAMMSSATDWFLASAIAGDESQHFIVLYVVLKGIAQPGMNIATMTNAIVDTSFVSGVGSFSGLQTVADLSYM